MWFQRQKNAKKCDFIELYHPEYRIRFSTNQLKQDDNFINIPLFMVEYLDRLLELWWELLKISQENII